MTQATWIIQSMFREGNLIAAGAQPTTAEQTEALYLLNRLVDGVFGFEMGENLSDWLVPAPQRTAPVASRYPQGPISAPGDPATWAILGGVNSANVWPYPPTNRRIFFGSVTNTVYFQEQPDDGARMAIVQGSGKGDAGTPGTASGVLTQTALPTATHTVTLGGRIYTWVAALTTANQVLIGATVANSLANLAAAINHGDGENVVYGIGTVTNASASATVDVAAGTLTATALYAGAAGNSIGSTTTDGNGAWAAATLLGGVVGAILTLDGNGRLIDGAPQQQYETPIPVNQWVYRADLGNWLTATDLALLDEMPFPKEFDDFFICAGSRRLAPRYNKISSAETLATAQLTLSRFQARYRQSAITTYGSENMPRTDQSYLGGSWWW